MTELFNHEVAVNPIKTKADVEKALIDLCRPMLKIIQQQIPGRVRKGTSGSVYTEDKRQIEGFLRLLWGLGPLFKDPQKIKQYPELYQMATEGILAGTDPTTASFWGADLADYDQLFVEMGSLGAFLIETKPSFWDTLTAQQQKNIYQWLDQINHKKIPHTNWLFFRVLVNSFFKTAEQPVDQALFDHDLKEINDYYLDHGWYFDGYINQIDYYIPFAMHYYGLLYSQLMDDSKNSPLFKKRAILFANQFKNWFANNGAALPFGRSQTYRFAQSAFWDVLALTGLQVPGLSLGQIKHLALNNLRYWFKLPIFSTDGLLTVGYGYDNLVMGEGYNAPGSPYWALKDFILLAIPDNAPFWTTQEQAVHFDDKQLQPEPRMLLVHGDHGDELQAFTAGQHSHEHAHAAAKYEKYVYSTTFGFSVPKGQVMLKQGAFDSTLAISETGLNYQTVYGYKDYQIHKDYVYADWQPFDDVEIKSYIVPFYPWHIRIHQIKTGRHLFLADGGFATPTSGTAHEIKNGVYQQNNVGLVGAVNYQGDLAPEMLTVEPNTNMLYPLTTIPTLTGEIDQGEHTLIAGFVGSPALKTLKAAPTVELQGNTLTMHYLDTTRIIELKEI